MHPNKCGRIDTERPLILDRLGLTDRNWTTQAKATESEFYRAIGAAESLIDYAKQIGQHWTGRKPPALAASPFSLRPSPTATMETY